MKNLFGWFGSLFVNMRNLSREKEDLQKKTEDLRIELENLRKTKDVNGKRLPDLERSTEKSIKVIRNYLQFLPQVELKIVIDYTAEDIGGSYVIIGLDRSFKKFGELPAGKTQLVEIISALPNEMFIVQKSTPRGDFVTEPITAPIPEYLKYSKRIAKSET